MKSFALLMAIASICVFTVIAHGEVKIISERNENGTSSFKFKNVPSPRKGDAAKDAKFRILDGERDPNGGDLETLHDGKLPGEDDQPSANFFFNAGTEGGRIQVDLGSAIEIRQINSYSWHGETRGPQVYKLYGRDASSAEGPGELKKGSTGKTIQELGEEWKKGHQQRLAAAKAVDSLENEKLGTQGGDAVTGDRGWKVLFNGKNLDGWHNFRTNTIRPGWQVKEGLLVCADPHNAGDLCTEDQYDWFELELDYNISEGGNSGIIYHASDKGRAVWATGPEVQLEDNAKAADPQRCGWLYGLYQPPDDPATGKPLDATKPAGEWNHVRLLVTPEKCEHEINGVKYFEYVLNSDDFKERVAKSKFGKMPLFAKFDKGYIALQGDHGQVSFRNIKIRSIEAKR